MYMELFYIIAKLWIESTWTIKSDGQIKSITICQDRVIRNQILALQIYMDEAAEYTLYDHLYDNFLTEMF